jgi:SNF2 family DNA or RNA helicase
MHQVPELFKHQKSDIAFELANKRVFDTSDPGTGKTRTRLEVYAKRRANGAKSLLVIAPKSILRSVWEQDCRKFTPWLKVSCAFAENREKAFAAQADIYVTNHDAVKWLAKQPPKFFDKFSCLVIDESGAFKHHTSDRSRAMNKIKKFFEYRTAMNGTPNPNTITDIWNQTFILDDGKTLGPSFYAFRAATQMPEQCGPKPNMVKWTDRPGAEAAVADLMKGMVIRNIFEECHDIPPNHNYVVPFELTTKLQKAYDQMEASAVAVLDKEVVTAVNAASVMTKMLQIASGAVYDDTGNYHMIDTARYELVAELVEQRKHTIVFFLWKHQKDLLIQEFEKRGITYVVVDGDTSDKKKHEAEQHYQAGFYRVLLAHPQSAAHGYTFTRGTTTIWPSPTYNLEHWLQGNRRIYRAGQKQKTETINIIAEGTIEERVHSVLCTKNAKMKDMLKAMVPDGVKFKNQILKETAVMDALKMAGVI